MHPLVNNFEDLKDSELESSINELTKKYFMTSNFQVQQQISLLLDTYKEELSRRRQAEYQKMMEMRNKDLDKLIRID